MPDPATPQDYSCIIQTTTDGVLDAPTPLTHVRGLVQRAAAAGRPIVIHLHGGLVSQTSAHATVNKLQAAYYQAAGLTPIFIVWRTAIPDALKNFKELASRPFVEKLAARLIRFLVGKFAVIEGKSLASQEPDDAEFAAARAAAGDRRPLYPELDTAVVAEADVELTPDEARKLGQKIEFDDGLNDAWDAEVQQALAPPPGDNPVTLDATLATEAKSADEAGGRALLSGVLAKHAALITFRILRRYARHSQHGLHATVIEEILREFFIDDIGTEIWGFMKKDSADAFDQAGQTPERGGWLLVRLLGEAFAELAAQGKPRPPVSVVAHSAGAIYACHLINHLEAAGRDPGHPLHQKDFRLHRLVFLAPACTHDDFAGVLARHAARPQFDGFRFFGLTDAAEGGYYEVPVLYPASLLYLVSGLFETKENKGVEDQPLVGMQRYLRTVHPYENPEVVLVNGFLRAPGVERVLSGDRRGPGLNCDSHKHGAFDEPGLTMESVIHFLKNG